MLSLDTMRRPLRLISITFDAEDQAELIHQLRMRAYQAQFASRVSSDPGRSNDLYLQFYRRDMKFIGHLNTQTNILDLTLFHNDGLGEPKSMYDFIVMNFRDAVLSVPSTKFEETIFLAGDDISHQQHDQPLPEKKAKLSFLKSQVMPLTDAMGQFAESQQMAVRFQQIAPGPENFSVDMYREDLMISGITGFPTDQMQISIRKTGDRSASDETVAATLVALQRAVEKIPGVRFVIQN